MSEKIIDNTATRAGVGYTAGMEIQIPTERYDRMTVQPTSLDTGARRLPVVIAKAGVLDYPWGRERVTPEVLNDPEFILALQGLPVMVGIGDLDHPERVDVYDAGGAEKAGVILSAEYDPDRESIVGVLVLDTPEGLAAVQRGVRGVSLGYKADEIRLPIGQSDGIDDGATHLRTRMYRPNHLVLTLDPRGGSEVSVRADSNNGASVDKFQEILDACMARLDAMEASMAKMMAEEATEPEHQVVDEAPERLDAEVAVVTAGEWRELFDAAREADLEIADDMDIEAARKLLGVKLVGEERADSLSKSGALRDVIRIAGELKPKSARNDSFSAWAGASVSVPVVVTNPDRQDSASAPAVTSISMIGRA